MVFNFFLKTSYFLKDLHCSVFFLNLIGHPVGDRKLSVIADVR